MHSCRRFTSKLFPLQVTKRFYFFLVLLFLLPSALLSLLILRGFLESEENCWGTELYAVALHLDSLMPESFDKILEEHGALDRPPDEKAMVLKSVLQPLVNDLSLSHPGVGMGYYSRELGRGVALSPDSSFARHPHINAKFKIYQTGKPDLFYHNSKGAFKKPVMLMQTYPIYREGKLIGHTWASVRMESIYSTAMAGVSGIFIAGIFMLIAVVLLNWQIFRRLRQELKDFAKAVARSDNDPPGGVFPELNPILDLVKSKTGEMKAANDKLRQLADIVEFSDDAIVGVTAEGIIYSWNTGAKSMYGYEAGEVLGKPYISLFPAEKHGEALKIIDRTRMGESFRNHEVSHVAKNGASLEVSLSISPMKNWDGKVSGFSAIARDVTGRKQAEKEMLRLERLNLIGQMAAGFGHEIRNPMTTIRGFLQVLSGKKDCNAYSEYFNVMIEELDRANSIITEFLSLSKGKPGDLTIGNLNSIIGSLYPLILADAMNNKKNVVIEQGDIPDNWIDAKEIRQLILNIARNGLEAMTSGGVLTIRTYLDSQRVVLAIMDQGMGIDQEACSKIGTPFFTTKESGTGLGLAVCYGIAARHGAVIDIETGGSGTTFYIRFPVERSGP